MTMYKVFVDNRPFNTNDMVECFKTFNQAKAYCIERNKDTGRQYRIALDGMCYFDTLRGDNISNMQCL